MIRTRSIAYRNQMGFQRENAKGKTLNVGCHIDGAGIGSIPGNVNVDVLIEDHQAKRLAVHALSDCRALAFRPVFDTVVLGEILEHMEEHQALLSLEEAKRVLKPGGQVVITMPHKYSENTEQDFDLQFRKGGIHAHHYRAIPAEELHNWLLKAGLEPIFWADIDYVWGAQGSAVVAKLMQVAA